MSGRAMKHMEFLFSCFLTFSYALLCFLTVINFAAYTVIPRHKLMIKGGQTARLKRDKKAAEKIRSVKSKALRSQKCHEESL